MSPCEARQPKPDGSPRGLPGAGRLGGDRRCLTLPVATGGSRNRGLGTTSSVAGAFRPPGALAGGGVCLEVRRDSERLQGRHTRPLRAARPVRGHHQMAHRRARQGMAAHHHRPRAPQRGAGDPQMAHSAPAVLYNRPSHYPTASRSCRRLLTPGEGALALQATGEHGERLTGGQTDEARNGSHRPAKAGR